MIIFFGPAGAGKSVQGQILAARHGWRWLSIGQLLRDSKDPELLEEMSRGVLIEATKVNHVVTEALQRAKDIDRIILDGFPRKINQAEWLVKSQPEHSRAIQLVVVLEVPKSEIVRRLHLRGRADDTTEAIEERLHIYRQQIYPILSYFTDRHIPIVHVDGTGTVGQVHDRIEAELVACSLA